VKQSERIDEAPIPVFVPDASLLVELCALRRRHLQLRSLLSLVALLLDRPSDVIAPWTLSPLHQ
jgi:hypothetical protein